MTVHQHVVMTERLSAVFAHSSGEDRLLSVPLMHAPLSGTFGSALISA